MLRFSKCELLSLGIVSHLRQCPTSIRDSEIPYSDGTHLDIQNAKGKGNGTTLQVELKALGISNLVLSDKLQLC